MSLPSPTIEGFRAAFRRPALTFAEIAWRWTLGSTAVAVFVFYSVEYLDTLPVTPADAALLSTRQPALVGRAIEHILRGSLNRAALAALVVILALSILWMIAASIGRLATVRVLLDYFRRDIARNVSATLVSGSAQEENVSNVSAETYDAIKPRPIRALIDLNFLRVAVALATMLALGGAAILASFTSSSAHPRPGLVVILFVFLAGAICLAALTLNWWLSFAGIFAVRDGEDVLGALSAAVACFRQRTGAVLVVSTWSGLAHLVAFSIATTAVSFPLAFIRIAPSRLVIAGMVLAALAYFAVADWLYMARLAGYICIAEMPDPLLAIPPHPPAISPSGDVDAVVGVIDIRDEPILSDVSNLPVEA
jgi:hypothetical protein